ncbi:MAG: hypothetical protein O2856_16720, partial [Planctomycetota bacterium]|nr:hypothetical protein [Planctomycetota bacterium]
MFRNALLFLIVVFFRGSIIAADEKSPKQDESAAEQADDAVKEAESIQRKARVDFLTTAVQHFEIRVGSDLVESKLHPQPLLVWNNPVSGTRIEILAMFTRNDRPDVIAQFSFNSPTTVIHEF